MDDFSWKASPQLFMVSDFLDWNRQRALTLNPAFQRRQVWSFDAMTYLIDTMLNGYPIPPLYLRTRVDTTTQGTVRDVVDGQQRLRTVLDFASNQLRLNSRSSSFRGLTYEDLSEEFKQAFLSYQLRVEVLTNADDESVLEVFARLNTYTVPLNAAEKRHAKFQGEFKWTVITLTRQVRPILSKYKVLTSREMLRMADDAFCAEMLGILIRGVQDGGAAILDRVYKEYDREFAGAQEYNDRVVGVCSWIDRNLDETVRNTIFSRSPQFLILFAAIAHHMYGIPDNGKGNFPVKTSLKDPRSIAIGLSSISEAVENDDVSGDYARYVSASSGATTRVSSRFPRFEALCEVVGRRA